MIKAEFRVWSKSQKRYIDGDVDIENRKDHNLGQYALQSNGTLLFFESEEGGMSATPILDAEVELFTGLKDKNGVEIYEGDIIKFISIINEAWNIYKFNPIFAVKFKEGAFGIDDIDRYKESEFESFICVDTEGDVEIIGNIHENPELLEETK